jgi:hypothetical protein
VAFVTARASAIAEQRAAELGIESAHRGEGQAGLRAGHRARLGIGLDEVAFMGDDLPDLRVMAQVGFSVRPASAHAWVRERVHWRTSARAGHGAAASSATCCWPRRAMPKALLAEVTRLQGDASRATHELARGSSRSVLLVATRQRLVGLEPAQQGAARTAWRARRLRADRFRTHALNAQGKESFTLRAPRLARDPEQKTMDIATPLF